MVELALVLARRSDAVEALARLQLAARRSGCELRLRHAEPALVALLDLVGLGDVLPPADPQPRVAGSPNSGNSDGSRKA